MDKLEVASIKFAKEGQVTRIEAIPLYVQLRANNWIFPDALDLSQFLNSLNFNGLLPLFTCSVCGQFGCSGYYVDIRVQDQYWQIANRYDCIDSEKLLETFSYQIPWWQIDKILTELQQVIQDLPTRYPYLQPYLGTTWIPSMAQFSQSVADCPYLHSAH
jgi:hypothetical protein